MEAMRRFVCFFKIFFQWIHIFLPSILLFALWNVLNKILVYYTFLFSLGQESRSLKKLEQEENDGKKLAHTNSG